jgi:hypothetical protein
VDLLASRLRTPLQVEQYLTLAFEEIFQVSEKEVTAAIVAAVVARHIDDLEPRLTRYGHDVKRVAEEFRIKPGEARLFLQSQFDRDRTCELTDADARRRSAGARVGTTRVPARHRRRSASHSLRRR